MTRANCLTVLPLQSPTEDRKRRINKDMTQLNGLNHYPQILAQIASPAQDISAPPSVCSFTFYLRSIPSVSPVLVGCQKPITAFTQTALKQHLSPITSLLIMRLSRLVYSGTMMKYTSLRQDNEGEGWEGVCFPKSKMERKLAKQTEKVLKKEGRGTTCDPR